MSTQDQQLKEFTDFFEIDKSILVGEKGDKGDKGEKGDTGEKGDKGDKGDKGERGEQGLKGERGLSGEDGIDGKDGKDGKDGENGKDGKDVDLEELKTFAKEEIKERVSKMPVRGGTPSYAPHSMQRKFDYRVYTQTAATRNHSAKTGWEVILCDCTSNNITINLPTAVGNQARLTIKKIDSSGNTVTIDGSGSQTIDGGETATITSQYSAVTVVSDNSNWHIV